MDSLVKGELVIACEGALSQLVLLVLCGVRLQSIVEQLVIISQILHRGREFGNGGQLCYKCSEFAA